MNLRWIAVLSIVVMLIAQVHAQLHAEECDRPLRATSYRQLPRDGGPKDGIVDYKLINQLLMSLQRSVRNGDALPEGFTAEITEAYWKEAPVGGIALHGSMPAPHRLAGRPLSIEVQRIGLAVVVTVATPEAIFERDVAPQDFLRVFPFLGPGKSLWSLVQTVQQNPEMDGWIKGRKI